jgi:hypothetical protein
MLCTFNSHLIDHGEGGSVRAIPLDDDHEAVQHLAGDANLPHQKICNRKYSIPIDRRRSGQRAEIQTTGAAVKLTRDFEAPRHAAAGGRQSSSGRQVRTWPEALEFKHSTKWAGLKEVNTVTCKH